MWRVYDSLTSTSTPAGRSSCIKASMVWALGFSKSMRRRCVLISKCSRESLFTWGDLNTQYTRFLVGSGTGPMVLASEFRAASKICWHACSIKFTQYDRSLMRIFCFVAVGASLATAALTVSLEWRGVDHVWAEVCHTSFKLLLGKPSALNPSKVDRWAYSRQTLD